MLTNRVPKMRLLLIKSTGQFAHSGKYYLSGGRWHAIHQDKPAPKGAPVAAIPHAAGQHLPATLTTDQVEALKYPADKAAGNHEMKNWNEKHLPELLGHAANGDATAILGMGYGSNTHGKKKALIANHLLEKMGSKHVVKPGQKAGEHIGVQGAAPAPAVVAAEPVAPAAEEGPKNGDTKQGANGQHLEFKDGRWHKVVAADEHGELPPVLVPVDDKPAEPALSMPAFVEGKTVAGVVEYYQKVSQKVLDLAAAADVAGLEAMPTTKGKTWQGKTENSKLLMALHAEAMKVAGKGAAISHLEQDQQQSDIPAEEKAEDKQMVAELNDKEPAAAVDAAVEHLKQDEDQSNLPAAEKVEDKKLVGELEAAQEAKQPRLIIPKAPREAKPATSKLDQIPWDAQLLPDTNKNSKSHNKQVSKIKQMAYAGDLAGLEAFSAGKNTYGKAQNKLAQTALAALKESTQEAAPLSENLQALMDAKYSVAGKPAYDYIAQSKKILDFANDATHYASNWLAQNPGKEDELSEALMDHHLLDVASKLGLTSQESGPHEGDTKQGADGMLVLKDGHWVKQAEQAESGVSIELDGDKLSIVDGKWQVVGAAAQESSVPAPAMVKKLSASEVIQLGKGFKTSSGNKAKIKAFAVAGNMEGLKQFISTVGSKMPASKKLAETVLAAMEAAPEVPAGKPKKASKPKAAPAQAAVSADGVEPMDAWDQTGPQGGSNPGGRFKDANGQEWYCKFPADEDTAKAEVLSSKLYAALGISGQDAKLVSKGGKVGIASKWTSVSKAPSPAALAKTEGVASGFGADAWLGNWDVVGMGFDNLQIGADGKAHRVDAGGSLMYRAQGGKKAFGNGVIEIDSLRDPKINPQAAAVFGGMTEADITASVAKVLAVSDFTIATLVHKFGPGSAADKQALIETLVARKADLAAKFPAALKKKAVKFKPEDISAPPDFMNWGSSGKSGPSSKPFLNEANHKAAQNIFDAAKSGDIKAVQVLTAPIYNKDSGEITGSAPVLEHPSQHIKGYAQQVINEINYQLNPPKKFRFDGGHPLHALNSAYPAYKGALQSQNVAKVAKFINLGDPGLLTLDSLGLEKKTYQAGTLSQQTYKKHAQAAIAKMPATQKEAVKAYTGSSYHSINSSLWNGNPSGQAESAAQALHTLGHDIEPGTVLSRKINLSGTDLQQLINSKGKVLQEPAIMSTSIRPSCWSGNVHLKLHVGPGVKGLWAGSGSMPGGGALSNHSGEDEIILPPNTRLMIIGVKSGGSGDADGFGAGSSHVVEAVILPSEGY